MRKPSNMVLLYLRRIIFAVIAATVIFGVISGIQKKAKTTGSRVKLSIGVSKEPITALIMIADKNGYFLANGLDVAIKYSEGGNVAIREMFEGLLDMVTVADNMVVFNSFKRQDFRVIATIGTTDNEPKIVARKDRGIIEPADLKGKRIGTVRGTAVHYFLHLFLMKYGMSEEDVKIVLNDPKDTFKLFSEGKLDAISSREPFIIQSARLFGDNATVFSEPALLVKNYNVVALNEYVKNNPDTVKKLLKALTQAEDYAIIHPREAASVISAVLGFSDYEMSQIMPDMKWKVFLEQSMLRRCEDQAVWMVKDKVVDKAEIPNYFNMIYTDGLSSVKPEAVTIIK
ncbi:MAG: ABC transporter substrate-binding protein [Nitrospirae bacterium]|nr:ABC transporter substrate-binding protein [Nitrospirota bacterium]